jgi:hypothetical protein
MGFMWMPFMDKRNLKRRLLKALPSMLLKKKWKMGPW